VVVEQRNRLSGKNLIMGTRPNGQPIATLHVATTEDEGTYSEGSQSTLCPCHVIQDIFELKLKP
jgi:hypothetical protein